MNPRKVLFVKTLAPSSMDSVMTMNLNDGDSSMTPFFQAPPALPAPEQKLTLQKPQDTQSLVYQPTLSEPEKKAPEKNISKSKGMDSTPLSDIMMPGEDYAGAAGGGADPRYMMAPQPSYVQQQMPVPQGYAQPQKPVAASKNPLNLTDEQLEALLAGAAALLAFSGVAQDKLSTLVPKFLDEVGKRSTVGTLVTALLAAILFYFGRKFVVRE
jgi:hypothetical protein